MPGKAALLNSSSRESLNFGDAFRGGWRSNEEAFFFAVVDSEDRPVGCVNGATASHKNEDDRQKHVGMGFVTGCAKSVDQLNSLAESL